MSNTLGAPHAELRGLVTQNVEQFGRATIEWLGLIRNALTAAEANVAALCEHACDLAKVDSPAECMRLQAEFLKRSMGGFHQHSESGR